jgi:hypothetical protein
VTAVGNGRAAPLGQRLHVLLRGVEQLCQMATRGQAGLGPPSVARLGPLPIGEVLHPATVLAVLVLVGNDWWAKPAHPGWLTGKLSDVAGLMVAPLVLTAVVGLGLHVAVALGAPWDPSLRRRRLALSLAVVAGVFIATKLNSTAAGVVVAELLQLGGNPRIVTDPTDLLALPALLVPWWVGRAELRLVPRGKVHALLRRERVAGELDDMRAAGARPELVANLDRAVANARVAAGTASLHARLDEIDEVVRQLAAAPAREGSVSPIRPP